MRSIRYKPQNVRRSYLVPIIDLVQVTNQWTPTGATAGEAAMVAVVEAMEGEEATFRGHKASHHLEWVLHLVLEEKAGFVAHNMSNF